MNNFWRYLKCGDFARFCNNIKCFISKKRASVIQGYQWTQHKILFFEIKVNTTDNEQCLIYFFLVKGYFYQEKMPVHRFHK